MYRETKELINQPATHPCLTQWRKRVDDAEKRGSFTESEMELAANWNTCAIGEARMLTDKVRLEPGGDTDSGDPPVDPELNYLGYRFYADGVSENRFDRCRELLSLIEARLEQL